MKKRNLIFIIIFINIAFQKNLLMAQFYEKLNCPYEHHEIILTSLNNEKHKKINNPKLIRKKDALINNNVYIRSSSCEY